MYMNRRVGCLHNTKLANIYYYGLGSTPERYQDTAYATQSFA
jgi:hypothetical protein